MTTYIDSSVLVAVYVPEHFSPAAREAVREPMWIGGVSCGVDTSQLTIAASACS